jgi:SAM-dependent methyltransferase
MLNEEKEIINKYDEVAEEYHNTRSSGKGFYNEYLEMPSTLELLGKVKGKKVLDFGCGSGIYAKLLTKKGAIVKGFDISPKMLEIAKKENPNLDLRLGSGNKIPFNEKFDIIVAPLVLNYLENWNNVFRQIKKLLNKGGIFVFSTRNPVIESFRNPRELGKGIFHLESRGYFREIKFYSKWKKIEMSSYHKTYETIIKIILNNDFEIIDYKDCFPLKKSKKLFPNEFEKFSKIPFFCVWKLKLKEGKNKNA